MKINYIYKDINAEKSIQGKDFRKKISFLIDTAEKEEKIKFGFVNLVFCNDELIRDYNKKYLGHDYETDIITFHDMDIKDQTEGELLISVETVKSNSVRFRTDFDSELYRVIIHGVLHLCGYKDKTAKQKSLMREKENFYLKLI